MSLKSIKKIYISVFIQQCIDNHWVCGLIRSVFAAAVTLSVTLCQEMVVCWSRWLKAHLRLWIISLSYEKLREIVIDINLMSENVRRVTSFHTVHTVLLLAVNVSQLVGIEPGHLTLLTIQGQWSLPAVVWQLLMLNIIKSRIISSKSYNQT